MKKLLILLIVIILASTAYGFYQKLQTSESSQMAPDSQPNSGLEAPTETNTQLKESSTTDDAQMAKSFTLADVAKHARAQDCWIAVEGKVYDVTKFIDGGKHPGGAAIIAGCGQDATALFNDRPNGSGAHSDKARSFLPNFYIGDIVN